MDWTVGTDLVAYFESAAWRERPKVQLSVFINSLANDPMPVGLSLLTDTAKIASLSITADCLACLPSNLTATTFNMSLISIKHRLEEQVENEEVHKLRV